MWRRAAIGSWPTSMPATDTWPPSASSSPVRIRRNVVLPAPLGPSRAEMRPAPTRRSTPDRTCLSPNDRVTSRASRTALRGVAPPDELPVKSGQNDKRWLAGRAAVATARILAELVGLAHDVVLVDLVARLVRVDERVVGDGTEVHHYRSCILHGVPPSSNQENYEAKATIPRTPAVSTLMMTSYEAAWLTGQSRAHHYTEGGWDPSQHDSAGRDRLSRIASARCWPQHRIAAATTRCGSTVWWRSACPRMRRSPTAPYRPETGWLRRSRAGSTTQPTCVSSWRRTDE